MKTLMGEIHNTNGTLLMQTKINILKHLNQEIRETGDVCCPLHEDLCLQY
jgi:hypothetical protein